MQVRWSRCGTTLLLVAIASLSCAPTLVDDGFRKGPLAHGCHTAAECRKLIDEAKARAVDCGTSGHVACEDVARDHATTLDLQEQMQGELEAKHIEATRAQDMRASANVRERVAAEERAQVEAREASERSMREVLAVRECAENASLETCGGADVDAKKRCESRCAALGEERRVELFHAAFVRCLDAYTTSNGSTRSCTIAAGPWAQPERQKECDAACADAGRRQLAYDRTRVLCCDGTRSPTCTYGTMRSGCCSSHTGACPEEPPRLTH